MSVLNKAVLEYNWSTSDPSRPYVGSGVANTNVSISGPSSYDAPPEYPAGTIPCWHGPFDKWVITPDYRQIPLWDKATGKKVVSPTVALPDGLTDIEPTSKYDYWDETKKNWVKDQDKEDADKLAATKTYRSTQLAIAKDQIDQLNEIIDYLTSSEDEDEVSLELYQSLLKEWTRYRAKLNIMKITTFSVVFPVEPKLIEDTYE